MHYILSVINGHMQALHKPAAQQHSFVIWQ